MYWQEEQQRPTAPRVREDIVDVVFALSGRTLPIEVTRSLAIASTGRKRRLPAVLRCTPACWN